jgi:type IV pilus assembly protein PilE
MNPFAKWRAPSRTAPRRGQRGVTLIELAIVMAVVGILMAVAIPSYRNQVLKSRRAVAQGCLLQHSQYMERWYTDRLTYDGASEIVACSTDVTAYYEFDVVPDTTTYTITATPISTSPQAADSCAAQSINSAGVRTPSTYGCWQ